MLDDVADVMMRSNLAAAGDIMRWTVLLNYIAVQENCNANQLLKQNDKHLNVVNFPLPFFNNENIIFKLNENK